MRTLKYLIDKTYSEMEKTDLNEIPSEITLEYFADLQKDKAEAERVAAQLNELRNKRLNKAPQKGLIFL